MEPFKHDEIVPFRDSALGKKQQVTAMFDRIAFRYDFLNHFLSAGIDSYWRKRAIRELVALQPHSVLDVASGTGDMAILLANHLKPKEVIGIDLSEAMLAKGRQKIKQLNMESRIRLEAGDSESIAYPNDRFDAITVAFGVRNFENLRLGLKEMYRVLKPGGRLVILEFSRPRKGIWNLPYQFYCSVITPLIGKMISRSGEAYKYLTASVEAFPEGQSFIDVLEGIGFTQVHATRLSAGICTIYAGSK